MAIGKTVKPPIIHSTLADSIGSIVPTIAANDQ